MIRKGIDPLPNDLDVRMVRDSVRDLGGKSFAVDRQRGSGGNAVLVGCSA